MPIIVRCAPCAGVDTHGASEAVNAIVEDTTQCKFEATSAASDEVVLFNILQVMCHDSHKMGYANTDISTL